MTEDAQFNMDALAGASVEVAFLKDIDPLELSKTICAMANSRGGRIYVGVFDEGHSDRRSVEHRVFTPGVNPNLIGEVTKNLTKHFDDPLPQISESVIDVPGQSLPVVKIVVERHSEKDQVALIDRTIWIRKGNRNKSTTSRARLIRSSGSIDPPKPQPNQPTDSVPTIDPPVTRAPVAPPPVPETREQVEPQSVPVTLEPVGLQLMSVSVDFASQTREIV